MTFSRNFFNQRHERLRTVHIDFYVHARGTSTTATQPPPQLYVAVCVPSSPAIIFHESATATGPIPTTTHVYVNAESTSGVLASLIIQDTALLLTQPHEIKGPADACPSVLNSVFECLKVKGNLVKDGRIGWRCHWCGKWFSERHATCALCHVTRAKMKKGIAPCTGPINLESQCRCV